MYWQEARHPRAGLAIGTAILVAWIAAVAIALATGDSGDGDRGGPPATRSGEVPNARPGLVSSGYFRALPEW
jgi:hypothetical protein